MKKVNFTFHKTGWLGTCRSTFTLKPLKALWTSCLLVLAAISVYGQTPNCTNVNAGINGNDTSIITVQEFVTNAADVGPVDVEILGTYGQRIFYQEMMMPTDSISLNACPYLDQQLKLNVTVSGGTAQCWSYLTFKQGNGPVIIGRSKTVYCLDPLVQGGDIHGTPPVAEIPCAPDLTGEFVADWVTAFDCIDATGPENDTAKIILREYEAFDKFGIRGAGFDTIIVLRLPEIAENVNFWCRQVDTLYCGKGPKLGPYMVLPLDTAVTTSIPQPDCEPLFFVDYEYDKKARELKFFPNYFDPKCGISVAVDYEKFHGDQCAQAYRVDVEIKQTCAGLTQPVMCDATDFSDSYHPIQWAWTRTLETSTNDVNATWSAPAMDVFTSTGALADFKNYGTATMLELETDEDGDFIKGCVIVPQDGQITFDYTASGNTGYYINNWPFALSGMGMITVDVRAGDEFCFVARNASGDLAITNFAYAETPPASFAEMLGTGLDDYYLCSFWVYDIDTVAPELECYFPKENQNPDLVHGDTIYVPASSHDCAAHTYIPPARVVDHCAGVKLVKARIEGITTLAFERTSVGSDHVEIWESHKTVKIPHGLAVPIIYEAFDSCHNVSYDTCYLLVKDLTRPVAVADKGVTVGLSSKKVWVEAETFDEGSWDNCAINFLFARRSDWYDEIACVDLCDDLDTICYDEDHHELLVKPILEDDKHVEEVEAYYANFLKWLKEDDQLCSDIIWNSWCYDLMKHGTLKCIDHKYEVDDHYFKALIKRFDEEGCDLPFCDEDGSPLTTITHEDLDLWESIGGGWSDAVPFTCEDACEKVKVEILVVDYWCNFAKNWTNVLVEDKTPVEVEKDVQDLEITCGAYKEEKKKEVEGFDHPLSVAEIVDLAKEDNPAAFTALDELFGGYEKVWRDEYGNTPVCDTAQYHTTQCTTVVVEKKEKKYDEHLGGYEWITTTHDSTYVLDLKVKPLYGQVVVNCSKGVQCIQKVWCDFDQCGQGYIYRKWAFVAGCPEDETDPHAGNYTDTVFRKQVIWVGNDCPIGDLDNPDKTPNKGLFHVPEDQTVFTCGIEYDDRGNATGELSPDALGYLEYKLDDDCRLIGIGYEDKVFKIVGGEEGCYKILRKWHYLDWCYFGGKSASDLWWLDKEFEKDIFSYTQEIIVKDTVAPTVVCEDLDTVDAEGCELRLTYPVTVEDECGAQTYYWTLFDADDNVFAMGSGALSGDTAMFTIVAEGVTPGAYKLQIKVQDECENETIKKDDFIVGAGKKPSAICITSLTAELTPMDSTGDGIADFGMVTIWAKEFNSSSEPACGGDVEDLEFRLELRDGIDDDTFEEDSASLDLFCENIGTEFIRMWVIDPTGTADFCDVMLVVQNNMNACSDDVNSQNTVTGLIRTELNQTIEDVEITAELEDGRALEFITNASGAYAFAASFGQNLKVTPNKDINPDNGISTLDLVKIQQHILGMEELNSEYKLVAADANNDGKVSSLDLIDIRKLILGEFDEFPSNTSWRFFADGGMEESYTITPLSEAMAIDFVGVKIGDANNTVNTSRSGRNNAATLLSTADLQMTAGNEYEITLTASEAAALMGYQFTVKVANTIEIVDVLTNGVGDLTVDNFGTKAITNGVVTTSYNNANGLTIEAGDALFTVVVRAIEDAQLSEVMTINSSVTAAEAYSIDGSVSDVSLTFTTDEQTGFVMYQNQPNPFDASTMISFQLPEAANATLTVFDAAGKVIFTQSSDFNKGLNSVEITAEDLNTTGVLYYQISSEQYTGVKKMIRL